MMSETVVTMDGSSNNASNNPRQVPTVKTEPGQPNLLASIRLNVDYFKTIPGIIKLVQLNTTTMAVQEEPVLAGAGEIDRAIDENLDTGGFGGRHLALG
ncbi:hypothetical protein DMN91_000730 [Ooceraea biroi]|uniref:Uncharacterized protein n=1 Tax=Ooceraea biroi TaxID=2015173 RepID=A0A3L8E2G7_OOCBI|nr:hypothetical protein DMN91_000730 [Ooceraea biroi]